MEKAKISWLRLQGLKVVVGIVFLIFPASIRVEASQSDFGLGVHVLDVAEIEDAKMFSPEVGQEWGFITVPLTTEQMDGEKWQSFMDRAYELRMVPIVRLVTKFQKNGGYWMIPTRADVIILCKFLSELEWHTNPRRVVVFNEPNHATEWGGRVDPVSYAKMLSFTADWFHTQKVDFMVLPAGLDAAAPNGKSTMDSFMFIEKMVQARPEVLEKIDAWTSHSYPNPGFSASAFKSGKNSIKGWEYELDFLKNRWNKDYVVYITETGWDQSKISDLQLKNYYRHAMEVVWNDARIEAITPFVLNGNNGIFNGFSLLSESGQPTQQMRALLGAWKKLQER